MPDKPVFKSSLDREKIKALLFDIDGTLSDSDDEMVASIYARMAWLSPPFQEIRLHKFARQLVRFFRPLPTAFWRFWTILASTATWHGF